MGKIKLFAIIFIVLMLVCGCSKSEKELEQKLIEQENTAELRLDSITGSQWDTVYFVAPYVSKDEIEKEISISSPEIQDNYYDESTIYMIFTYENNIAYKILGNPKELGFTFDVGEYKRIKKLSSDECIFSVVQENGSITYKLN